MTTLNVKFYLFR